MADVSAGVRMEIVENPFQVNGELSQKADYILSHSTITRTEIHIEDPDTASEHATQEIIVQESRQTTEATVPAVADGSAEAVVNKPSGHDDTVVSPQAVEVEVKKANAAAAEPQRAEEVKLKKRRSCCSVQ